VTVCIGAVCADPEGRVAGAVVVASDRMVTLAGLTEFEHEVPKITPITGKAVALTAGDAQRGSRLVRDTAASIPSGTVTVDDVVKTMVTRYVDQRRRLIEAEIFTPRGITEDEFYKELQQKLLPQIVGGIDRQVVEFNYGADLLVGGVDDAGGHLYVIHNPGIATDTAPIGFRAIGSGWLHAMQSMIGFGHTAERSLHETVFSVYASKRRAEVAPGVGRDTDVAVIVPGGVKFVAPSILEQLAGLYEEYQRPVSHELMQKVAKLSVLGEDTRDVRKPR